MTAFTDMAVQALGWTLLHFVWQGALVAAVLAIARSIVRSSYLRYAISVVALMACAVIPLITFSSALTSVDMTAPAPMAVVGEPSPSRVTPGSVTSSAQSVPARQIRTDTVPGLAPALTLASAQTWIPGMLARHAPAIVLVWGLGVMLMMARLVRGCWLTRRLRRIGVSPLPAAWKSRAQELSRELGLRHGVRIFTSSIAAVPMVVGVLRPVVLIPVATFLGLTREQLEAIVMHELMHVRRHDGLVILLERVVEAVLFYHPAVWWISSCSRIEREHCCDDAVAQRTDVRLYAGALASVEELRRPIMVAAATDGSLGRIRRLLTPVPETDAASQITLPNVIATLALTCLMAATVGMTRSASATPEDSMNRQEGHLPGTVLKGVRVPTRADIARDETSDRWLGSSGGAGGSFSTIVDATVAALGAGGDKWSAARVAATFGYPFHFAMKDGAVNHDHNCNIETWLFFDRMNDLGWKTESFQEFTEGGSEPSGRLPALREQTWKAVTASIDRGMPAIAWSPRQDRDFSDWGLLVGYDADAKTYHVSHVNTDSIYSIPYDGFGEVWFSVLVFTKRTGADPRAAEIATLRHAIEFSKGLRYTVEESENCCGVDAIGLAAYQLWLDALKAGSFDPGAARWHAWQLMHTRQLAADYAREAADRFDGAVSARLMRASDHYVQASELSRQLLEIVQHWAGESPPESEVEEARRLLEQVLQWERGAIMYLEVALLQLGEQIPGDPTNPGVATLQQEPPVKVDVDVVPTEPHRGTTLASSLAPVMQTLGEPGWTPARIQGVLGHLFHFQMAEGGGNVFHDNLDWSLGLTVLQELADYRVYEATKEASKAERVTAMTDARNAVRASLKQGVPAMVWSPRSVEQRQQHHPGGHGACWGIIVGYDEAQETYSIRHPFVWQGDYSVRYDEIAEVDPAMFWFNIMVFDGAESADDRALHHMALVNAVSFADGTHLGDHKWTQGFAAYEQWLEAFESPDLPGITHHHANMLTYRRELAAEYLRDLSGVFEEAAVPLEAAAGHYEREHAILEQLRALADVGRAGGYSDEDRAGLGRLLRGALEQERAAVARIKGALKLMDGS